ncbi:alpha-ketoglutarate dependent xanthine dioxygenase [Diplodia corticola]|uniref:Alpha-ketoglutarate dependent xanthine dioxygenase n=1 Tax=Diplodia corticola TaxID=236234 RepID=A0A1J9RYG0_9PEZI|nr:alpha-ketoglutarate dependent xanthine dioxygenase [Diplodia corticola]OJD32477.1 alpha-ketoglutarate dependent xanthine dioxygenase [Diplodia corticola]
MTRVDHSFKIEPIQHESWKTCDMGAVITGLCINSISDAEVQRLKEAIWKHKVVVVRDQGEMLPEKQLELVLRLDPSAYAPTYEEDISYMYPRPEEIATKPRTSSLPISHLISVVGKGKVGDHYGLKDLTLRGSMKGLEHEYAVPFSLKDLEEKGLTRFHYWHMDAPMYRREPALFSSLRAIKLPSGPDLTVNWDDGSGLSMKMRPGATAFLSGELAYELLDDEQKAMADHSWVEYQPYWYEWTWPCRHETTGLGPVSEGRERSDEHMRALGEPRDEWVKRYPMVWIHPASGRKLLQIHLPAVRRLFVRTSAADEKPTVVDDLAAARAICRQLYAPSFRPEHLFAGFAQAEGDLVLWDNRATLHTKVAYPDRYGARVMHQVYVNSGTPPVGAGGGAVPAEGVVG